MIVLILMSLSNLNLAADDFLRILLDDRVRKEMHNIFESAILSTIDEKF